MRAHRNGEHAADGEPGDEDRKRVGEPGDERVAPLAAHELPVDRLDAGELVVAAAVDDELRRAAQQLDERRGQLAALRRRRPAAERRGDSWNGESAREESEREHQSRRRQQQRRHEHAAGADDERDERRPDPAQVQPLQRVHVGDDAADEITAPVAAELARRERLDPLVHAHADARERAQREVVRGEPVEVAGERAREREEAHRDDRHRQ